MDISFMKTKDGRLFWFFLVVKCQYLCYREKKKRLKQAIWDGEGVFRGRFGKRLNFAPFPMDDG